MVFHTPGNDTLDKYIPRDMLPEEYGGKAGKVDDLKKYWVDVLRSKRYINFRQPFRFFTNITFQRLCHERKVLEGG